MSQKSSKLRSFLISVSRMPHRFQGRDPPSVRANIPQDQGDVARSVGMVDKSSSSCHQPEPSTHSEVLPAYTNASNDPVGVEETRLRETTAAGVSGHSPCYMNPIEDDPSAIWCNTRRVDSITPQLLMHQSQHRVHHGPRS